MLSFVSVVPKSVLTKLAVCDKVPKSITQFFREVSGQVINLHSAITNDLSTQWQWQSCHSPCYKSVYLQNDLEVVFKVIHIRAFILLILKSTQWHILTEEKTS